MKRRIVLGGVLALAGCGLSERPYAEKRQWPLLVSRPSVNPPRTRGKVLLVRDVVAAPGLDVRGLQSLQPDGSLRIDFYEEWSVPPAESVGSDLRQWLADSNLFAAVVAPGSRLAADLVLETSLTALLADLPAGRSRMTLSLVLLRTGSTGAVMLEQRRLFSEHPLAGADAPAIVGGLRADLADVLAKAETVVGRHA